MDPERFKPRRVARRSHVAIWAFAFALLLKSGVPLMASASAALQGKALADVCDVYGVATIPLDARGVPLSAHAVHGSHGPGSLGEVSTKVAARMQGEAHASSNAMAMASMATTSSMSMSMSTGADPGHATHATHAEPVHPADHADHAHHSGHDPAGHAAHAGDHCALTAVVALAATATPAPMPVPMRTVAIVAERLRDHASPVDASARWAARLRHGPPAAA